MLRNEPLNDHRRLASLVAVLAFGLLSISAFAAETPVGTFEETFVTQLQVKVLNWINGATRWGTWLLAVMAGVDIIWSGIIWILEKNDLQSFTAAFVRRIMVIGFFFGAVLYGSKWLAKIIMMFVYPGQELAGLSVDYFETFHASTFIDNGIKLFQAITGYSPSTTGTGGDQALDLQSSMALAVMTLFVSIGAMMFVYQFEGVFVVSAGILFLGFGGSKFTEQYATRYISYAVGIGIKIFVFLLIIGLIDPFVKALVTDITSRPVGAVNLTDTLSIFGVTTFITIILKSVPTIAMGITANVGSMETGGAAAGAASQAMSRSSSSIGRAASAGGSGGLPQVGAGQSSRLAEASSGASAAMAATNRSMNATGASQPSAPASAGSSSGRGSASSGRLAGMPNVGKPMSQSEFGALSEVASLSGRMGIRANVGSIAQNLRGGAGEDRASSAAIGDASPSSASGGKGGAESGTEKLVDAPPPPRVAPPPLAGADTSSRNA